MKTITYFLHEYVFYHKKGRLMVREVGEDELPIDSAQKTAKAHGVKGQPQRICDIQCIDGEKIYIYALEIDQDRSHLEILRNSKEPLVSKFRNLARTINGTLNSEFKFSLKQKSQ